MPTSAVAGLCSKTVQETAQLPSTVAAPSSVPTSRANEWDSCCCSTLTNNWHCPFLKISYSTSGKALLVNLQFPNDKRYWTPHHLLTCHCIHSLVRCVLRFVDYLINFLDSDPLWLCDSLWLCDPLWPWSFSNFILGTNTTFLEMFQGVMNSAGMNG